MCVVPECSNKVRAKGYCAKHYARVIRNGHPDIVRPGGRPEGYGKRIPGEPKYFDKHSGYISTWDPEHPHASKHTGFVKEHIYVMTKFLGRPLYPDENVHHINGDRKDNRLENLELWSTKQPKGQRVEDKLLWAYEIINRYGKKTCE